MNKTSTPVFDSHKLSSIRRSIQVPFKVLIDKDENSTDFICSEVLRVLPGKRMVSSGDLKGIPAVVKFFLNPRKAEKHCLREVNGLNALNQSGIRTSNLLFKGRVGPDGLPALCFEKIDSDLNHEKIWNQKNHLDNREENLKSLVSIIAKGHVNGLKQDDVHLGNFLSQGKNLYTIDGANIDTRHMGKPLSMKKSIKNLGLFFAQILPFYDGYIKSAFNEYLKLRKWAPDNQLYNLLIHRINHHRSIRKKKYLKKIYRQCSEFICCKSWKHFMVVSRKYLSKGMEQLMSDPDAAMAQGRLIKDGGASTVVMMEVDKKQLVVKRYNRKSMKNFLKRCLRNSRAYVSWRNSHLLSMLGVSANIPVAMLEKRWGLLRLKAYFISEYIEGPNAYDLLHSESDRYFDTEELINQFVKLIETLSKFSVSHGDFKATNFLVSKKDLNLIDLDAMREHRWNWKFNRAYQKDLKRLMKNWDDLPDIRDLFLNKLKQAGLY